MTIRTGTALELRQLRQFVVIAEELSFRRAATRLHMSQPPLTVAVQRLESMIGTPLLSRNRRQVRLTTAGTLFLNEARRTLAQAQRSVDIARQAPNGIVGILRLSFVTSATFGLLPELLRRFRQECPTVHVIPSSGTIAQQMGMLKRGDIDLALIRTPLPESDGINIWVLRQEKMALAVPIDHPLAGKKRISVRSLATQPFITYPLPERLGFEGVFIGACERAGFFPRIVGQASQILTKLSLVSSGIGLTLVPASIRMVNMPGVRYLEVTEANIPLQYTLALAARAESENPAVDAFVSMARRKRRKHE